MDIPKFYLDTMDKYVPEAKEIPYDDELLMRLARYIFNEFQKETRSVVALDKIKEMLISKRDGNVGESEQVENTELATKMINRLTEPGAIGTLLQLYGIKDTIEFISSEMLEINTKTNVPLNSLLGYMRDALRNSTIVSDPSLYAFSITLEGFTFDEDNHLIES